MLKVGLKTIPCFNGPLCSFLENLAHLLGAETDLARSAQARRDIAVESVYYRFDLGGNVPGLQISPDEPHSAIDVKTYSPGGDNARLEIRRPNAADWKAVS